MIINKDGETRKHSWKLINKFSRICLSCGLKQMGFSMFWMDEIGFWWEDIYPLPKRKCPTYFSLWLKERVK